MDFIKKLRTKLGKGNKFIKTFIIRLNKEMLSKRALNKIKPKFNLLINNSSSALLNIADGFFAMLTEHIFGL